MTQEEIIEKLRPIISTYVEDKELLKDIKPETDLLNDLKINSVHVVDIILDTEDAFNIEIDDDAAEEMLTVGAAVDIISQRVNQEN